MPQVRTCEAKSPKNLNYCAIEIARVEDYEKKNDIVREIICFQCQRIPLDPIQCSECEMIFCCEYKHLQTQCPQKCSEGKFVKISKITQRLYDKIKIRCQHSNKGCQEALFYKDLMTHEIYCDFQPFKCIE